jgi:DNA-binding MarR family transcriptional regulator
MNRSYDELWDGLAELRRLMTGEMQAGLAGIPELDLPLPQSMTLFALSKSGPVTVSALQLLIRRSQSATSHMVNQLQKRGLASRKADPLDGRRTTVELTSRGHSVVEKVEALRRQGFRKVLGRLPPKVARQLEAALKATVEALEVEKPR